MRASTMKPAAAPMGGVGHTRASTVKCRPISMGDGTVRNRTTRSEDSRRPGAPKPAAPRRAAPPPTCRRGRGWRGGRPTRPRSRRRARRARRAARRAGRAGGQGRVAERATEQGLAVLPRDALGDLRRQIGEPGPGPRRVLRHVEQALGRERVGADHEAVGELEEDRAASPPRPCRPARDRCGRRGRPRAACAWRAARARAPAIRSPQCAHRMRAAGSWRKSRSMASASECACSISPCCFASWTMRRGTGRSASAP